MSFFLGGGGKQVKPQYTGIQLQTSSSTIPITLLWGLNRLAPNIFWYDDFKSHKEKQKAGKGFGGSVTSYTYSASILLGLCQGPISGVYRVFRDEERITDYTSLGFSLFTGTVDQAPWGYLTAEYPDQALSYSGVAYLAAANYGLGSSASTPQHGFETGGLRYNTGPLSNGDADCALVISDLLTNPVFGAGFTSGTIDEAQLLSGEHATTTGDNSFQTYCRALGIGISPALSSQETAGSIIDRWTRLTDTATVWTGYSLKLIPYGTEEVVGHGYHYLPNTEIVYVIRDMDCVTERGQPPVMVSRSDPADTNNSIKLTLKNRQNEYNPTPVEWKDQGLIDQYGLRQGNNIEASEVTDLDTGNLIVSLIGQREAYTRNTYEFTLPPNYCLLEPMDILAVNDPLLGNMAVWVEELEEQDNFSWKVTAKEIPPGVAGSGDAQGISNNPVNRAADPGPVNTPIIFQPPVELSGTNQVWIAASGGDNTTYNPVWGGCYVYVSTDGVSYQQVGEIVDACRQGVLTSTLDDYSGDNPDTTDTLSVDLSMSDGMLQSASPDDALRGVTVSYVGGELISYEDASLVSANEYDLATLYRGLYGSAVSEHPEGTPFARLDAPIFRYDVPEDYVGVLVYFKFQSYNIWGNAIQDLADCAEYTYTPIHQSLPLLILDGGDSVK